jgi:uncharacterized protein (UPF0261 family)
VPLLDLDYHINDPEFGHRAVEILLEMMAKND